VSGLADAFQTYQSLTGGTLDSATGLLSVTPEQYANLLPLTFDIGGKPYELTPNAQIWPRSLNTAINGSSTAIYLVVGDIGTPSGSGLDFTNGYTFLYVYIPFSLTSVDHRWYLRSCYFTASASTACMTLPSRGSALPLPNTPSPKATKSLHRRGSDLSILVYLSSMRSLPQNLKPNDKDGAVAEHYIHSLRSVPARFCHWIGKIHEYGKLQ
jgi:hypothetical protein